MDELNVAVALNDGAAHARALAARVQGELHQIARDYPNNRLGGSIERLHALAQHLHDHAHALTVQADRAIAQRPEAGGAAITYGQLVPGEVLAIFQAAQLINHPVSEQEAGQATAGGRLVVLRDAAVQAGLVTQYGAIFEASVDPALVRLWWPRVLSRVDCPVALIETEVDNVWRETTLAPQLTTEAQPA